MALAEAAFESRAELRDAAELLVEMQGKIYNKFGDSFVQADWRGKTALMRAAERGVVEFCQILLNEKEIVDQDGRTALDYALAGGNKDVVRLLAGATFAAM